MLWYRFDDVKEVPGGDDVPRWRWGFEDSTDFLEFLDETPVDVVVAVTAHCTREEFSA